MEAYQYNREKKKRGGKAALKDLSEFNGGKVREL